MCGMLSNDCGDMVEEGFLAFLRLIGTKKHYAAIVLLKGAETLQQLFTLGKNNFLNICIYSGIAVSEQYYHKIGQNVLTYLNVTSLVTFLQDCRHGSILLMKTYNKHYQLQNCVTGKE